MIKSIMKGYAFFIQVILRMFFFSFVFEKISSLLPIMLVTLFGHAGKRSNSCSQIYLKTGVFLRFCNIRRKTPVLDSLFNKVAELKACVFIKKETPTQEFSCEYCKIFKSSFLQNTCSLYFSEILCDNRYNIYQVNILQL